MLKIANFSKIIITSYYKYKSLHFYLILLGSPRGSLNAINFYRSSLVKAIR